MKFSDKYIAGLKPKEKMYQVREARGFGMRVLPSGVKIWIYIYLSGSKRRQMNLGHYPYVSLADARSKYMTAATAVAAGEDPQPEPPPIPPNNPTVSGICDNYLEYSSRHHSVSWHDIVKITLNAYLLKSSLADYLVADVTRRQALQLIDSVAMTKPGMARTLLRIVRAMFGWAVDVEIVSSNPFVGLKIARTLPSVLPKSRERVLDQNEIEQIWSILSSPQAPSDSVSRALKLILTTGQRPGEVAGMAWPEIQFGEGKPICQICKRCGWWTIPSERSKNRKPHRIWLSPQAFGIMGNPQLTGPVFPSPGNSAKSIKTSALSHAVAEGDCKSRSPYFGLPRWTPHDLRRTVSTQLAALGCPDEINDAILNHAKKGIIATYNRHKYDNDKQIWIEKWSDYLESLVS